MDRRMSLTTLDDEDESVRIAVKALDDMRNGSLRPERASTMPFIDGRRFTFQYSESQIPVLLDIPSVNQQYPFDISSLHLVTAFRVPDRAFTQFSSLCLQNDQYSPPQVGPHRLRTRKSLISSRQSKLSL